MPSRRDATWTKCKLTNLLLVLLVALARLDCVLGGLGLGDGLLNGDEPSIALGSGGGLEGVLVARDLERESDSAVLGEVSGIGLMHVSCGFLSGRDCVLPS